MALEVMQGWRTASKRCPLSLSLSLWVPYCLGSAQPNGMSKTIGGTSILDMLVEVGVLVTTNISVPN